MTDQRITVRMPAVDDFRVGGMRAPGILLPLQWLDLVDAKAVELHVSEHGPGLVVAVLASLSSRIAEVSRRRVAPPKFPAGRRSISSQWLFVLESIPDLGEAHSQHLHRLRQRIRSAHRLSSRPDALAVAHLEVPVTLIPTAGGRFYMGKLQQDPGPKRAPTALDPYDRAEIEAIVAASADGTGLSQCDQCGRYFAQVRSGDRYSRFCPGYPCAAEYRKSNYEKSPYRVEYQRRRVALSRLRKSPTATAAEIERAEMEFETWKRTAKESNR